MKISTKGRYAVRCMLNLAIHYDKELQPISQMSKQEDISPNYIEQLLLKLNKAGLVESIRGRSGGYRLLKKPEKITIAKIIEIVEGPIILTDCVGRMTCKREPVCTTKYLWCELSKKIEDIFVNVTLKDLCEMAKKVSGGELTDKVIVGI
ncbi:RrF2 family transcriptional regulator [Elusimicrobiota bacterium]